MKTREDGDNLVGSKIPKAGATIPAQQSRASQTSRLEEMFEQAPGFMAVLRGPDHVFELANAAFLQLVGQRDLLGKTVREAMPDVEGQGFFELLDQVYETGERFIGTDMPATVQVTPDGPPEHRFVNFVYQPITDESGAVSGIFIEGVDATAAHESFAALEDSSLYLRLVLDSTGEAFYSVDRTGATKLCNAAFLRMLGFEKEADAVGRKLHDVIHHTHPDGRHYPKEECPIYICAQTGQPGHVTDELFYRLDGSDFPVEYWVHPIYRGAELQGAICNFIDITERKLAESAVNKAADEFTSLADNVSQLVWMAEPDGSIFWYNKRWYDYTGTDLEEMLGWGWRDVHHPDHIDHVIAEVQSNWAAGEAWEGTYLLRSAAGEYRWFLTRAEPIRDAAGTLVRWFGTNTDVTEQREAEARQKLFLALADRLRELTDPREMAAASVEALGRHLGVSRVGFGEVCADGETIIYETDYADGVAHLVGTFPLNAFGRENIAELRRGLTTTYADVTADPRTADADFAAIETRSAMAVPLTREGHLRALLYLNHREVREWAPAEVALVESVAARTWDALERARAEAELREVNATLERRVEERTAELLRAEEALRQAQKMEAVGQLTGGIAHDFNNMLAVVIGSLDLLGRRIGEGDARARRYVDAATDGARRAALLTQRLLAFSRQQPLQPEPIDLNKLVAGMSDLLRHSLGADVRLETVLAGGLWRTHADPNQLENVILNLAVNGRDSMPEGGRITIETQNAHLDARYAAAEIGVPAGQYVLVAVTDSGSGMPADVIAKAFDPFFTTKGVGKGTGLGLSQVYGFVKQSGGHVKIYSEPGQGTTVKVYLPRLMGQIDEAPAIDRDADLPMGDSLEVVLVVEDEPAVRQFSIDALTELGYRVLEADGAAQALSLLDAHPEIVIMFTDVIMPEVNGRKLADEAVRRRPDLRVLFTTGYTRNAVVHNGVLDPGVELIGKPFTIEELAAKMREVLDAPRG